MSNYQNFIAERIGKVPVSGLHRFFGIAASMPDVISLGVGEPDFPTPAPIARAAFDAIYERAIGYTANSGLIELRDMLAAHLQTHYDVVYAPENEILITVGVSEALKCVFSAICDDGDEIIVPQPCFVAYEPEIIFAGGVSVPVICKAENDFEPFARKIFAPPLPKKQKRFLSAFRIIRRARHSRLKPRSKLQKSRKKIICSSFPTRFMTVSFTAQSTFVFPLCRK